MYIILAILLAFVIYFVFFAVFKIPKIGSLVMTTGGVKTGKSMLSVWFTLRVYNRNLFVWHIKKILCKIFRKPIPEKPLIYSNIPLKVPYVPLTEDLLLRKKRFNYKSVIYVCEASLVADSMHFRNQEHNERLLLLNKLIAHETMGGTMIYDTQSIQDVHYSIKRSLSQYFYIHRCVKWIPFVCVLYVKEYIYQDDKSTINVESNDIEQSMKRVIVPKKIWKYYDCYCYSAMTDSLSVENKLNFPLKRGKKYNLKANNIVSFKPFITNKEYLNNEK